MATNLTIPAGTHAGADGLVPLAPRTLVEQVVDAIIEAAAKGIFLPGDRIVEAEVARRLEVSRVPVREALRLLESQGIVESVPYRGMRLMDVSADRLRKTLKVRLALEKLAAREFQAMWRADSSVSAPLDAVVAAMHRAVAAGDGFGLATLDTRFHRTLCMLTGNQILLNAWEPLSRQLTIIFGLSTLQKGLDSIAQEHVDLLAALKGGDRRGLEKLMETHILEYSSELDYEGLVARRRAAKAAPRA